MSREKLLVLDVGLTHAKSILFDPDGSIVDARVTGYPTVRSGENRVEQDPEAWWAAIRQTANELWQRHPSARASIAGVGVTGHMHALVCLGQDSEAVGSALILGDRRAVGQAAGLTAEIGAAEIYRLTGALMDASMPAAKIRWLREVEPGRWAASRAFLGCKDFIRHRLTGDLVTDPIDACATSLYDITNGSWSDVLTSAAGVDSARLPAIRKPEEVAGGLQARAASELGLVEGTPVAVGAGDDIEVLGNGLVDDGGCLEHVGTTGSILAVSARDVPDPTMSLELYPHAISGLWVVGGSMTAAGAAIAWAADVLGFGSVAAAFEVLRNNPPIEGNVPAFSPHLFGERVPHRVPGAQGFWMGLEARTSREGLMLAVFEGVAFGLRAVLDRVDGLVGRAPRITVSEARDADPAWLRLRASVYERPLVSLRTSEPTALGAMIVLATAIGAFPDLRSATLAHAPTNGEVAPDPARVEELRDRYERYLELADALRPTWVPGS